MEGKKWRVTCGRGGVPNPNSNRGYTKKQGTETPTLPLNPRKISAFIENYCQALFQ